LLPPCDVTADSEEEAMSEAETLIGEAYHPIWQEASENAEGDPDAVSRATALVEEWLPAVRRVDRPKVELRPRVALINEFARDGVFVGETYDYTGPTGEQSYDVLLDGVVEGVLVGRLDDAPAQAFGGKHVVSPDEAGRKQPEHRYWFLAEARGPLVSVADRLWLDPPSGGFLDWPYAVLADIRTALETESGK
jgi:hypothetical protein